MIDYVWLVPAFPLIGVLLNGRGHSRDQAKMLRGQHGLARDLLDQPTPDLLRIRDRGRRDVGDEAIQCKYHATQKYTPSAVKKPLLAFLTHYATSNAPLKYTLYAHFADVSSFDSITGFKDGNRRIQLGVKFEF